MGNKSNNGGACEHDERVLRFVVIYTLIVATTAIATSFIALNYAVKAKNSASYASAESSYLIAKDGEKEINFDDENRLLLSNFTDLTKVNAIEKSEVSGYIIASATSENGETRYYYKTSGGKWLEAALPSSCDSTEKNMMEIFKQFKLRCRTGSGESIDFDRAIETKNYK